MITLDNMLMGFLLVLLALCIFEVIKVIAVKLSNSSILKQYDTLTLKSKPTVYQLHVLFCDGSDRTCFLTDKAIAYDLLAYYNLDVGVQSVLLYDTVTDKDITASINH